MVYSNYMDNNINDEYKEKKAEPVHYAEAEDMYVYDYDIPKQLLEIVYKKYEVCVNHTKLYLLTNAAQQYFYSIYEELEHDGPFRIVETQWIKQGEMGDEPAESILEINLISQDNANVILYRVMAIYKWNHLLMEIPLYKHIHYG
jgi:hypothetical protein